MAPSSAQVRGSGGPVSAGQGLRMAAKASGMEDPLFENKGDRPMVVGDVGVKGRQKPANEEVNRALSAPGNCSEFLLGPL